MNKRLVIKQNGYRDCGPSCLLSIMRYYGLEASHEEVAFSLRMNNYGTNAYNIINGSKLYGFDGYGIHYSFEEIINNDINFPIICHVRKNNYYHFIVVYSIKKKYIEVMDPSSNNTKMTYDDFKKIYLNTSIVIYPVKKINSTNDFIKLNDFIFNYTKLEIRDIIKVILLSLFVILLGFLCSYYLMISIDNILPNYNYIKYIIVTNSFLIIYLVKNILEYIRNKYLLKVENSIIKKINNSIIRKFFNLPYLFFKNKSTGEIMSRLADLKLFKQLLSDIVVTFVIDLLFIIISLIILLSINYKLFFINLISMIFYYLVILIFKNILVTKNENILIGESEYNKILNETINGYEGIKNLNLINQTIKNIEIKYNNYIDKVNIFERSINNQNLIKMIILDIFSIISIFVGITLIYEHKVTLGEFILFNSILYYFTEPIKNILNLSLNINYLKNIYRRINDLIIVKTEKEIYMKKELKSNIVIDNLGYSHNGYGNTFSGISFEIKYGSKFLIYGNSGNGKSTIIKILLKYLNDYKGNIYFDGINLKDINKSIIQDNITYVSQNNYVNNDSLKNNIVFNRNITDEEYENVINICNLNDLRNSKIMRNDFIIEDNGFNISGGEKQKIILARSLLNKFNYLILDESLSEVNFDEEQEIMKKIFDIYKDKTIIYISHKKEIIELFDNKYKLERSYSD